MTLGIAFDLELPEGRCVGVCLPHSADDRRDGGVDVAESALEAAAEEALPNEELVAASAMAGRRRRSFFAGRLAVRAALARAGLACGAVLTDDRGAPAWPPGVRGSVSHKDAIGVALVARDDGDPRGVDVELLAREGTARAARKRDVSRYVLTEEELAELVALPAEAQPRAVLLRFSAKESIYKAVDPLVRRYIGFKEVSVWPRDDGTARAEVHLREGSFEVSLSWRELAVHGMSERILVTAARAARAALGGLVTSPAR